MSFVRPFLLLWTDASLSQSALFFDVVEPERWVGGADVTKYPVERGPDVTDNVRVLPDRCEVRVFVSNKPSRRNYWASPETAPLPVDMILQSWRSGLGDIHYNVWKNNIELRSLGAAAAGLIGGIAAGPVGGAIGAIGGAAVLGALIPPVAVPTVTMTDGGRFADRTLVKQSFTVQSKQFTDPQDFVEKTLQLLEDLKNACQLFSVEGTKKSVDNMVIAHLSHERSAETGTGAVITIGLEQIVMVDTQNVPAPAPQVAPAGVAPPVSHGAQSTEDATEKDSIAYRALH